MFLLCRSTRNRTQHSHSRAAFPLTQIPSTLQDILKRAMDEQIASSNVTPAVLIERFEHELGAALAASAADPDVAGFKSIACYRTGLDIGPIPDTSTLERAVMTVILVYHARHTLRLADRALNDYVVHRTMRAAAECGKPGQS